VSLVRLTQGKAHTQEQSEVKSSMSCWAGSFQFRY